MQSLKEISKENQKKAWRIIEATQVMNLWKEAGAEIHLVGSLRMGLMMTHRDIDFHLYTPTLNPEQSFGAMARLAMNKRIKHIEYHNLADTPEECLEWHAQYEDEEGEMWQIDMIHILKGSRYDGYFERMADRISEVITDEQRNTILRLKYETPTSMKIMGVEYYQAVIRDRVSTLDELLRWKEQHPVTGVIEWIP